jgi:hypothetical protein
MASDHSHVQIEMSVVEELQTLLILMKANWAVVIVANILHSQEHTEASFNQSAIVLFMAQFSALYLGQGAVNYHELFA